MAAEIVVAAKTALTTNDAQAEIDHAEVHYFNRFVKILSTRKLDIDGSLVTITMVHSKLQEDSSRPVTDGPSFFNQAYMKRCWYVLIGFTYICKPLYTYPNL